MMHQPPKRHMPALAKERLNLRNDGISVLIRERGNPNHVAKRMRHLRGGMCLKPREGGHVPLTGQLRECKETVLNGVQDR